MAKKEKPFENAEMLFGQMRNLENLFELISALEDRIAKMSDKIGKIGVELRLAEGHSSGTSAAKERRSSVTQYPPPEFVPSSGLAPKIIVFPGNPHSAAANRAPQYGSRKTGAAKEDVSSPITVKPGTSLPSGIPDFRAVLQRDGLILLSWDKRITEDGERYTAYWVTSAGTPRFYASKPFPVWSFSSACPDHKSYAAEDGIEFYGQKAPAYIVHVAPELMMSNPKHGELRPSHIDTLRRFGCTADFEYKYLLTREKSRRLPNKARDDDNQRAGA